MVFFTLYTACPAYQNYDNLFAMGLSGANEEHLAEYFKCRKEALKNLEADPMSLGTILGRLYGLVRENAVLHQQEQKIQVLVKRRDFQQTAGYFDQLERGRAQQEQHLASLEEEASDENRDLIKGQLEHQKKTLQAIQALLKAFAK